MRCVLTSQASGSPIPWNNPMSIPASYLVVVPLEGLLCACPKLTGPHKVGILAQLHGPQRGTEINMPPDYSFSSLSHSCRNRKLLRAKVEVFRTYLKGRIYPYHLRKKPNLLLNFYVFIFFIFPRDHAFFNFGMTS